MSLLLEARGLVKLLGGRRVVDGVDLVCRAGEVVGLLGPNGAGKTTTLRMLYGFLRPDAGEIRIEGSTDLSRMKRDVGVCTQNDTFDGDFSVEHYQRTWEGQLTTQIEMRHVVWGELLWAAVLGTVYATIVSLVLALFHVFGLLTLDLARLPLIIPLAFVAGCAFAAIGLYFTGIVPTIDHLNLPVFLIVLPLGFASATYFPLRHPALVAIATVNPLYHLAEGLRGLLLGGAALYHIGALVVLCVLIVLVPLDMRISRRRVLGE